MGSFCHIRMLKCRFDGDFDGFGRQLFNKGSGGILRWFEGDCVGGGAEK